MLDCLQLSICPFTSDNILSEAVTIVIFFLTYRLFIIMSLFRSLLSEIFHQYLGITAFAKFGNALFSYLPYTLTCQA